MTGYAFHPEARVDLDEIHDYIAGDSPDAADSVIGHVLAAIRALIPFPHQGHRRPDLTSRPLRFVRVHEYLIASPRRRGPCG
jgi:plasmid stabilization system protein ParE